ncbi:hypothetical protein K457DRAFT_15048 [Linnemannia elongata AG-77]|uniref:Uncharacterized protein n=1 Tax=Linnemannia elongata AG-77 TaxID=1314771 RepID=A0A197KBS1_9FUNG|nr:hypothetical protein K457DRAFT_15048 [Linnemannia elongata AG-77]
MSSHNSLFFGVPRPIEREEDLYLPQDTTISSYESPTVPPTIQDHHDAVQVQLDAAQALSRVLVVAVVMIAIAALVVVAAVQGRVNDLDKGTRKIGSEPLNIRVVTGSTLATADNPASDAGVGEASSPRRRVYYWGVQVSEAQEVSFPKDMNNVDNSNDSFGIIAIADGADGERESCWWNITMDEFQDTMASLPAPPSIETSEDRGSM